MTGQQTRTPEQHHRAIVERIVADLQPVRPRLSVGIRLVLWIIVDLIVAVWVIAHGRADLLSMLQRPDYLLELIFFGGAALLAAHLGLRSAVPGLALGKGEAALTVILALVGIWLLTRVAIKPDYPLDTFVRKGLPCAFGTTLFAIAPWTGLAWAVARNAPLRGFLSGTLVGGGATLFSFAVMRIDCPVDEPLHIFAWHVAPVILLITVSTLIGGWVLRFRPSLRLNLDAS